MTPTPTYRYRVYGLAVASVIPFPQLSPDAGSAGPEVRIEWGEVPESLGPQARSGPRFQATESQLLIQTRFIPWMLVENGNSIRIRQVPGSSLDDLRMLLLGWGLGAVLHQRGILPLHAGVVSRNGGAMAFCAASGTGKSTLTTTFVQRGYRMLDDNLAALAFSGAAPVVLPGSPEVKLLNDVLAGCPPVWKQDWPSWPVGSKTGLFLQPHFEAEPQPLRAIFILSMGHSPGFQSQRLQGAEAFHLLKKQIFLPRFLDAMGHSEALFRNLLALGNRVPVFALKLGNPRPTPDFISDKLEALLENSI